MAFTEQPFTIRTDEEIKDTLKSVNREVIRTTNMHDAVRYTVIVDALKELLELRKERKNENRNS